MADTNTVVTDESMFLDTDNFDFLSLDDVVEDKNELGYSTKQTGKDLMNAEDISDLSTEEEADELPDEDEDEDAEESEEEGEESEEEGTEEEGGESDEEEVDFESYEVTLPNGETVVLSEMVKGYKAAADLEAERAELSTLQEQFTQQSAGVGKYLELARLEADRVIEDYSDFDWAAYKKDDPVGYVENREFLDRYKARRVEIIDAMQELEDKKAAEEASAFQAKAKEAGVVLARDIPGWNNDMYQQLMMYAVENGADAEDVANSIDPVMFKILHKAMQYEKGKQTVKAKVKKVGTPSKVVKASSKPVTTNAGGNVKKAIIKKMENGGLNERELSNSFAFLED